MASSAYQGPGPPPPPQQPQQQQQQPQQQQGGASRIGVAPPSYQYSISNTDGPQPNLLAKLNPALCDWKSGAMAPGALDRIKRQAAAAGLTYLEALPLECWHVFRPAATREATTVALAALTVPQSGPPAASGEPPRPFAMAEYDGMVRIAQPSTAPPAAKTPATTTGQQAAVTRTSSSGGLPPAGQPAAAAGSNSNPQPPASAPAKAAAGGSPPVVVAPAPSHVSVWPP